MTAATLGSERDANRFRLMLGVLLMVFTAGVLVKWGDNLLSDPDTWWHIKLGSDIWTTGTLPITDSYSHTFFGQPFIAKEWLSQIIWFAAFSTGGWSAVLLLTILSICATAFLAYQEFARHLKPVIAAILTLVCLFLTSPIFVARPHVLTMPIVVIWTVCLFRAAGNRTAPSSWLLPLMVLWANLHAGFTVGFMIAGFAALHAFQEAGLRDRSLLVKWGIFLLLCPLVTLVHPYGYQPLAINISMASGYEALPYITEWQPFSASNNRVHEIALVFIFMGLLLSRLRLSFGKAGLWAFALHMFYSHIRFCFALFIVSPLAIARDISLAFPSFSYENWKADRRDGFERLLANHFGKGMAALGVLAILAASLLMNSKSIQPPKTQSIENAISFASAHHLTGNVMNSYDFGGPLIFHGLKTFIDGRADQIFLGGFITSVYEAQKLGEEKLFESQLGQYHIEWTMLTDDDPRAILLDRMPGWKREYKNESVVIHVRNPSP